MVGHLCICYCAISTTTHNRLSNDRQGWLNEGKQKFKIIYRCVNQDRLIKYELLIWLLLSNICIDIQKMANTERETLTDIIACNLYFSTMHLKYNLYIYFTCMIIEDLDYTV